VQYFELPLDISSFLVLGSVHTADNDPQVSSAHCTLQRDVATAYTKKRFHEKVRCMQCTPSF
jgi:hypothetical protein